MTYTVREPWSNPWYDPDPMEPRMPKQRLWNSNQLEIEYFFPLTEQIVLDLDYTDCAKPQLNVISSIDGAMGTTIAFHDATWTTTAPQLSITPTNSVGTLSVGGLNIGLEEKPNILQKVLFKLLGFKWK